MNERRPRGRLVLAAVIALTFAGRGRAAEVNGIWSESSTKDLGELSGNDFFKNWKIRGWAESYFVYSSNAADKDTVNANQGLSVLKARDLSIEGRAFDVHRNRPTLTILEVELEKVPQLSSWLDPQAVGFKVDVNWGDTYDIIWNSVNKGLGRPGHKEDVLGDADRFLSHYSIGYVAPVGKGLRVDFGKFVTHIGGETIESIKNNNFSHGYLYSFGIPFQDFGFRFNYPWTDTLYTEFYVLQGWNVTYKDNNGGKTIGPAIGWTPNPRVSMYAQYLGGPEQRDNDNHYRHLLDLGLSLNPIDPFNILLSADVGYERNVFSKKDTWWDGIMGVFRYKVTDAFEPAFRAEIYNDPDGFTTGVPQTVGEVTLTLNYRIDLPEKTHLLVRPEYRYDVSDANFFTEGKAFRDRKDQHTIGLGTVLYF